MTCFISRVQMFFPSAYVTLSKELKKSDVSEEQSSRNEQIHPPALMWASCTDKCWHPPCMDVKQTYIKMLTASLCGQPHVCLHGLVSKPSVSMVTAEKCVKIRKTDSPEGTDRHVDTLCSIKATGQKKGRCVMTAAVTNDANLCQEGCLKGESGSLQTRDERRDHRRGKGGCKQKHVKKQIIIIVTAPQRRWSGANKDSS